MAEEKRVIFSFLTLDGFKARLADGTFTPQGNYMVFIQDKKLIWTKGQYFAESNVAVIKLSRPTPKSPGYNITEEEARTIDEAYANGKVLIFIENDIPLLVKSITPSESEDSGSYEAYTADVIYRDSYGFKLQYYRIYIDTKSLLVEVVYSDDEVLYLTNAGNGSEYLANDGEYHVINQAKTLSSATAGQWIRFAELSDSGYNSALVTIKEGTEGATFFFKCRSNGEVTVKVMDVTPNIYLTKIRVIKQNGQSNGYLEAYVDTASSSIAANISLSININLTDITVTSKIPGGYTSEEVSLV